MSDALPSLRCSELDRTFRCPGWLTLSRSPAAIEAKDENSEAASKGSWGHYLIARWLIRYMLAYWPETGLVRPRSERPRFSSLERWAIVFCIRELRATCDADMVLEVEVELAVEFERFVLTGHIDVLAIDALATRAKAWDWKLGRISVDPADVNNQVLGYIVLLFLTYESLQEVTFYLVQPFVDVDDGFERVTEVHVTRDQLPAILAWFVAKIEESLAACMDLDTGEKQCRYCPAAAICPAGRKLKDDMKYRMTQEEADRLTTQSEDIVELVNADDDFRALGSLGEAVRERLKTRVRKNKGPFVLPDGRRVYFKPRRIKRLFDKKGEALYSLISEKLGAATAMGLYKVGVNAVRDEFAQSDMAKRADGTPLPKTSKKGPSLESVFDEAFAGETFDVMGEVLVVDRE